MREVVRPCVVCGKRFETSEHGYQKSCSESCKRQRKNDQATNYRARFNEKEIERRRAYGRAKYRRDPEKHKAKVVDYMKANPEKVKLWRRATRLRKNMGIEVEQAERMFAFQKGRCGLCGKPMVRGCKKNGASLDHDHITGVVREWLHMKCNLALGYLNDDPRIAERAAVYLRKHKEAAR